MALAFFFISCLHRHPVGEDKKVLSGIVPDVIAQVLDQKRNIDRFSVRVDGRDRQVVDSLVLEHQLEAASENDKTKSRVTSLVSFQVDASSFIVTIEIGCVVALT